MGKAGIRTHRNHSRGHHLPFDNGTSRIVIGAAAGCLIGATAALLLAPKQARHKFTQGLDNIYDQVTSLAEEYSNHAMDTGHKATQAVKDSAESICSAASNIFSRTGKNSNRNLILGIVGAGLLGASAVYALTQKPFHTNGSFASTWGTSKWRDLAKNMVDVVSSKLHEDEETHGHEGHDNPIKNVFDWAVVGLNFWQELKKRR